MKYLNSKSFFYLSNNLAAKVCNNNNTYNRFHLMTIIMLLFGFMISKNTFMTCLITIRSKYKFILCAVELIIKIYINKCEL